jgi:transposase-like protein
MDFGLEIKKLNEKLNNLNIKTDALINEIRNSHMGCDTCKKGVFKFREFVYRENIIISTRYQCDSCSRIFEKATECK